MMPTTIVSAPTDPSWHPIMADKKAPATSNALACKAQEFHEQLAAEETPVQISSTITLDLLEPIFTYSILKIPLDSQNLYKFSPF